MFAGLFAAAAAIAFVWFRPVKAASLVFPGAALVWVGLACYLLMLGLIAETALAEEAAAGSDQPPLVREQLP